MTTHRAPLDVMLLSVLSVSPWLVSPADAEDAARPVGEPVLEQPTLRCFGAWWIVAGDDNRNAVVCADYRRAGTAAWKPAQPFFRVERDAHREGKHGSRLDVPAGAWLFAGSVLDVAPAAAWELRLRIEDPDGGGTERILKARTIAEPAVVPDPSLTFRVVPGDGGGSGSAGDPFRGLDAAQKAARPGACFLLAPGVYPGTFAVRTSGEPGRPVVWRGDGTGEAILDGALPGGKRVKRVIAAFGVRDVWFERLTIRNGDYGLAANNAARVVVRRCRILACDYGFVSMTNRDGAVRGHFLADNVIEGPSTWPRSRGIENARGIQITGEGHVVCHNRVRGFADAIDTFPSSVCAAIDIHHNDVSELTDDGIEMDYSERNTRCFRNRLTNVFQGISLQPVHGGPVYVFLNVMANVTVEPFKLHNSPSGGLLFHNTVVKRGMPAVLATSERVRNCVSRNNLFVGTGGAYAFECQPPMAGCDFDYDGFAGREPFRMFLKWNGRRYATLAEVKAEAPVYRHAVLTDAGALFAAPVAMPVDGTKPWASPDLRLRAGSPAVDAGAPLPGVNDGFTGNAPDLGAIERGDAFQSVGPRPGR
jgi:hypothetical protein